mmetsp:Transcript_53564/g.148956  ORF Transcript_53564/g.148956 Transcript_53564/m.148956 type:complete len:440 (+) Transcript_53564:64-1383(+)
MLKGSRTVPIDSDEVDFMVLEYVCHDDVAISGLGSQCKESRWKVQAGVGTEPFVIKVHVDKAVVGSTQVMVECAGEKVFPASGSAQKAKMEEDIFWSKSFQGTVKGIGVRDVFEVRPPAFGVRHWFKCILTRQHDEGYFEVMALMPDGKGDFKEECLKDVEPRDIREASSKKILELVERRLTLEVPMSDALHATLSVDNGDLITHYFARPTPPPGKLASPMLKIKVNKERTEVSGDVGHSVLTGFVAMQPHQVETSADKLKHSWTLQIGPWSEHKILVEKKYAKSPIVTLTVDDTLLCEAAPEDLDISSDVWECKFQLKGEKCLNFEVYETTPDGVTLDSKDDVNIWSKVMVECDVRVPDGNDLSSAQLFVDGNSYLDLQRKPSEYAESNIRLSPQDFSMTYHNYVPYKINHKAQGGSGTSENQWGIFHCCMSASTADQ